MKHPVAGPLLALLGAWVVGCAAEESTAPGLVTGTGPWYEHPPAGANVCPVFPADNWWNQDISNAPVDPMSDTYLESIGSTKWIGAGFGVDLHGFPVGYIDDSVPKVPVEFTYVQISDPGPYPMPANPPIQPFAHDRHLVLFQTDECKLYEMFYVFPQEDGWTAASGVIWDLTKNEKRKLGNGSADAAGLAIYPGLIQYDEVESGEYHHAIRFSTYNVQNAYVHPATCPGQGINDPNLPPMGTRIRLKPDVDISAFSPRIQTIYRALKRYGAIVADRAPPGEGLFLDGIPDQRWHGPELYGMRKLYLSDFEVVETGPVTTAY
jgi:hypothetical protein